MDSAFTVGILSLADMLFNLETAYRWKFGTLCSCDF